MDLTEAEDIKKRWQAYTEELYKKDLHDPDNHGGLYTWAAAMGKDESTCGKGYECDLDMGDVQGVCPDGWHLPHVDSSLPIAAAHV